MKVARVKNQLQSTANLKGCQSTLRIVPLVYYDVSVPALAVPNDEERPRCDRRRRGRQ